ncbi:MAG TPA: FimV/HubP family polar landmark protein [Methylotenera sp.]|nr:FimV/HubP family polar landmark protein [Methylotenera sp.]
MRKLKVKQITLAVCLALMPFSGFAAGLGKLNVSSGLGEPLKAEIELLSVSPDELSTLVAAIASEESYAAQGITRLSIHNNIQVELAKSSDGSPILKLRTNQPISDPYLDMLIQVDWASGRLQREYTVLLDPPGYKQPIDNVVPMPVRPPSVNMSNKGASSNNNSSANVADEAPAGKSQQSRKPSNKVPDTKAESVDTNQELTTQRGDTLSLIAKQTQVEGVSLDQMLVGLYENNKQAFTEGNMNRLKVGQIIKVPSKESLTSISTSQAAKSVKIHSSNWNAYRNALAGAVASSPAMETAEQKQSASGKVGVAEDKAAPITTGPKDVVKLSAGDKALAKNGGDTGKALQDKIAALEEETTARENSLKEAQERTAALEKQLQDMQKLLAMKSQAMSDAQKNAETAKGVVEVPAPVTPEEKLTTGAVDAPKSVDAVNPGTENAAADNANTSNPPAETPVASVTPPVNKTVTPPQANTEPVEEPSLLTSLMNAVDLTILGALGVVALLGTGWMFLRNKRRKDLDSFERGILTSGGLRANTVFGNTTGTASTSDTSFLTDFAQSADGSMIDTNDVDPIAEAEVYMAYGRDAQAEEILKDAIFKEPKRYELHLKLLEMYAARKDTSAFEAIAGELYTTLGADDPVWIKVAEIGVTMEPENPLYDVSKSVPLTASITQTFDVPDLSNSLDRDHIKSSDLKANNVEIDNLDFSFDDVDESNVAVMQSDSPQNNGQEVSFDLGSIDVDSMENHSNDAVPDNSLNFTSELNSADSTIDFDIGEFNADTNTTENIAASADAVSNNEFTPVLDLSEMDEKNDSQALDFNMDFTEFSSPLSAQPEEVAAEETDNAQSLKGSNPATDMAFEFDMGSIIPPEPEQSELASSEMSFDLPSFDLASDSNDLSNEMADKPTESSLASDTADEFEASTFDLSTINLDLNEDTPEISLSSETPIADQPLETNEAISSDNFAAESPDVDIKLDLVAAYIDMDDKEGALELLDEVLKEGGQQQQLRAQQLIASLT